MVNGRDRPADGRFEGGGHLFPLRVHFEDTDLSGMVYHANYLRFMERARSDLLRLAGVDQNPSLLNLGNGSIKVKWQTNWDRDDQVLSYDVQRQGVAAPLFTTSATSQFWNRPFLSFTDSTTQPGKSYSYRISAYDADGNRVPNTWNVAELRFYYP